MKLLLDFQPNLGRVTIHAWKESFHLKKLEAMDRKSNTNLYNEGSISLHKKVANSRRSSRNEQIPDLTDFMNDMFFGSAISDNKMYNLTEIGSFVVDRND